MRILITGASGLLGTKLSELAAAQNHEVYATYGMHKPLYGIPVELDILNTQVFDEVIERIEPDVIVHAAALTDVDKCELERELAWKTNVESTSSIAQLCSKNGLFLVYVSTDYVFDGVKGLYEETDKPDPINYYGLTKLKGEEITQKVSNHCIARGSVIYGSTPATGKVNFTLWVLDRLRKKQEVKIVTDQWNSPTLNTSMSQMILEIIEKKRTGIFHLAGATRLSRYEFALQIAEIFNLDAELLIPVPSTQIKWLAKRPRDSSLSVDKAKKELLEKPLSIGEALQKMKTEIT